MRALDSALERISNATLRFYREAAEGHALPLSLLGCGSRGMVWGVPTSPHLPMDLKSYPP